MTAIMIRRDWGHDNPMTVLRTPFGLCTVLVQIDSMERKRVMNRAPRRVIATLGATAILAVGLAPSAMAEGGFSTHITNALVGFESRAWTDKNNDGVQTSVSHYSACSDTSGQGLIPKNVTYNLKWRRTLRPDKYLGEKTLSCSKTGSAYWGRVDAGSYDIKLTKINGRESGQAPLTVKDWRVKY